MKLVKRMILTLLVLMLLSAPVFSLAESDYEKGDGWVYQDGTLTITENGGLKDFVSNDQNELTGEWKYHHSFWDVKTLVIGRSVTELKNEIYEWNQLEPQETIIESGNTCFIIDHGWVVNTKTKTLFGAADVPAMKVQTKIVDLPSYIEHIGDGAFYNYRILTSVIIPSGVIEIGEQTFNLCVNLKTVRFPDTLQTIDDMAFDSCYNLSAVSLGKNTRSIGNSAFNSCYCLEKVLFYATQITKINERSFSSCNLLQIVVLPETANKIESFSFCACEDLTTLVIPSDRVKFEDQALYNSIRVNRIIFLKGKPQFLGNGLFGETKKTSDGRYFYPDLTDMNHVAIPYPTLYYTAAYASEWAPNGETEWNGYPIQQISQEELDAILAEARGEAAPESVTLSRAPTAASIAQETTPAVQATNETDETKSSTVEIVLLSAIAVVAVVITVIVIARKRKDSK